MEKEYGEACKKGCNVSQSRFIKSQLQCDHSFAKTSWFWVALGVAALVVTVIIALTSTITWRRRRRRRSSTFREVYDIDCDHSEQLLSTGCSSACSTSLESNISKESTHQRQEFSRSRIFQNQESKIVNSVAKTEDTAPHKIAEFSPQVIGKSPPVSLAWAVGIKATTIEIHELTFDFPANCLKQKRQINMSVRRYSHKDDPVYVYTITPHEIVFGKPVTIQLNSKWKSAYLRKRKSANDDWRTVGTFSDNSGVLVYDFCDLCPTYKRRTAELGEGFSFNNISVAAQRDSHFVMLEVNLLTDACNDTLQSQREKWKENAGSRLCGLLTREIALYKKGKIKIAVSTDETIWKKIEPGNETVDFGLLKERLGVIRTLLTCHLRPVEGLSVQEAIARASPCWVSLDFAAAQSCPKPGYTDKLKVPLLFGERMLEDDVRGGFFKPIPERKTVEQPTSSEVARSTSSPPTFSKN